MSDAPTDLDLKKDKGLTVRWADGSGSYYTVAYLRRMSPSADMRELRKAMARDPLTVVAGGSGGGSGSIVVTEAELVGNYALKLVFSDGHATGIYSWAYLREIDPANQPEGEARRLAPGDELTPHSNPLGLGGSGGA